MEKLKLSATQSKNLNFLKVFLIGLLLLIFVQMSSVIFSNTETNTSKEEKVAVTDQKVESQKI